MNALKVLRQALRYPDAQVRYRAVQSLASFPVEQWRDDVLPLLTDKVRSVRIAAADALVQAGAATLPESYQQAFSEARRELELYLLYQADFSVGNVMIGDFYYRQRDLFNAEKFYLRGLKKDSMMNYVRFNLSALYNGQSRNNDAFRILQEARATDPDNPRVYYNLALLQVEMKDTKGALQSFGRSVALGADDPRIYYNYGLLYQQEGNVKEAEAIFLKGMKRDPENVPLAYALAVLYLQQGNRQKAVGPAAVLKRLEPENPDYQTIYQALGM
jgi:tetratricopeptide (TPR) repeat protein